MVLQAVVYHFQVSGHWREERERGGDGIIREKGGMRKDLGDRVWSAIQHDQRRYTLLPEPLKRQLQSKQRLLETCPLKEI